MHLTLQELSVTSDLSQSHLGRIERGERFPSAHVLRRIAKPLGFEEEELFMIAGFLSDKSPEDKKTAAEKNTIDPLVSRALSREPVELQHAIMDVFDLMKVIAKNLNSNND